MPLTPGTRFGPYEILWPLGAGGMGEVYRARDPRLDREVAIKILSPELAHDPAALARFEREAMSVAKLSHPNILSIFDFAHEGTAAFVVSELVNGETLRARLQNGPLPPRRAVAYALQIARGMAAAHASAIVHRDLKPENVMITADEQVKILDFGLAKRVSGGEGDVTQSPGLATSSGVVLGTFGYMAPEQVRGFAVDHRADIFAFGAVLYEMLSGARAFKGETTADTMMAILANDPPDLNATRLSIPAALDRIVRRCLEKSPDQRFQSANDLAFALETLITASISSSAAVPVDAPVRRARTPWLPWTVAAVAVIAAVAPWLTPPRAAAPEPRWSHFIRITETAGEETAPTLSPDGITVAYRMDVDGDWDIYGQRVGGRNPTPIVNDRQRAEGGPAFSPDGSLLAFHESDIDGGIFLAGATGESVRRLTDIGFDPAWSPDGKHIAFTTEEIVDPASRVGVSLLYVVAVAGDTPRKVIDSDAVQASWSPSGERLVYWSNIGGQRDIKSVSAGGGEPVPITNDAAIDWCPVWSPDARFIYFSSDRGGAMNIWRIAVDQLTGRATGPPEPVTTGVHASAALARFSRNGSRLVFRSRVGSVNPVAVPFDPAVERAREPFLLDTRNSIRIPSDVSPDGRHIAYYNIGDDQEDLFIGTRDGAMRRVTDDAARDRVPMFTRDGRSLVFYSNREGYWEAWMIGVDGGGLRKLPTPKDGALYVVPSPKGDAVVYAATSGRTVFKAPFASRGSAEELPGITSSGLFLPSGWSADGSRLVGTLVSKGGRVSGVGVYDLGSRTTTKVSDEDTASVRWLPDSRRVVYFTGDGWQLTVLDTLTRRRTVVNVRLPAPAVRNETIAVSPDGRTIYYGAVRGEADIWIAERK